MENSSEEASQEPLLNEWNGDLSSSLGFGSSFERLYNEKNSPRTFFTVARSKSSNTPLPPSSQSCCSTCNPATKYYKWWILFFTCLISFGSYVFYYNISALNEDLKKHMKIHDTDVGLLFGVTNIPNVIMVLLGGMLIDRFGVRKCVVVYMSLVLIGAFLFCFSLGPFVHQSFWMMMAGRFAFGIGAESSYVAQDTIVAMWFRDGEVATAMGIVTAVSGLGEVFSFSLLYRISQVLGDFVVAMWLTAFLCTLSFISTLFYILLDIAGETFAHQTEKQPSRFKTFLEFPSSYWLLTSVAVVYYSIIYSFLGFAPDVMEKSHGLNEETSGTIISIISVTNLVLSPILGYIIDKFRGHVYYVISGNIFLVMGFGSFTLIQHIYGAYIAVFCIGLAFALVPAALWPCMVVTVDRDVFGTAYGLTSSLLSCGTIISFIILGKLLSLQEWQLSVFLLAVLSAFATCLSFIWAIIYYRTNVKPTLLEEPSNRESSP